MGGAGLSVGRSTVRKIVVQYTSNVVSIYAQSKSWANRVSLAAMSQRRDTSTRSRVRRNHDADGF